MATTDDDDMKETETETARGVSLDCFLYEAHKSKATIQQKKQQEIYVQQNSMYLFVVDSTLMLQTPNL